MRSIFKLVFDPIFLGASNMLVAVLVIPILWICEPFRRIRISLLKGNRICHLIAEPDLMMRRYALSQRPQKTTHVFLAWHTANQQALTMWKRQVLTVEAWLPMRVMIASMPMFSRTRFHFPLHFGDDEHEEWSLGQPTLRFTAEEEKRGRDALREMGIGEDDWFVGFHTRDPSYEVKRTGFGAPSLPQPSNRDSRLENYLPAAHLVSRHGGYALRMGAIVDKPFETDDPRVIDYATKHRTDFLDIYLSAKCRFFLGNNSGLQCVPRVFNVPMALANYMPYACIGLGRTTLYIPKLLRRIKDQSILTFLEIRDLGLMDGDIHRHRNDAEQDDFYLDLGLEWVENSADDVLDLCQDMMDQVSGIAPDVKARALQDAYRGLYSGPHASEHAGRIGPRFITKYQALLARSAQPMR